MANNKDKESKNSMIKMLNEGKDAIYQATNPLSRIWRILCVQTGVNAPVWNNQLDKWNRRNQRKGNKTALNSDKGNASRSLAEDSISWKSLMRGFDILEYDKIEIQITAHRRGKTVVVSQMVDIVDSYNDLDDTKS